MASNPSITEGPPCNSGTDEETIALRKKRSRRVSFADREITSVHIFNRDEDYETPPDSSAIKNQSEYNKATKAENEVLGFFRDLADSDDSREMSPAGEDNDDDDNEDEAVIKFMRPIESPSPGSSIVGSATSNDEDNFFGPVSAGFIRPGRLSDSGVSDENHDVTMDSTAFSMHYHSLAMSESGDLKTPTNDYINLEEKTPSCISTPCNFDSSMELTKSKNIILQYPPPVEKVSGGRDSNEMSLVGEIERSYNYGKLSPLLEALLAEGSRDMHAVSISDLTTPKSLKRAEVSMFVENKSSHMDQQYSKDEEISNSGKLHMSAEEVSVACMEFSQANGTSVTTLADQISHECLSDGKECLAPDLSIDHQIQIPNHSNKLQSPIQLSKVNNNDGKHVVSESTLGFELPVASGVTPMNTNQVQQLDSITLNESGKYATEGRLKGTSKDGRNNYDIDQRSDQQHASPLVGSISSLSAKRQQIFMDAVGSCRQLSYLTPSPKQSGSFSSKKNVNIGEIVLSVHKSNSMSKISQPSSCASSLKDEIEKSKLRLVKVLSATSPFKTVVEGNRKDIEGKHVDVPITDLERQFCSDEPKNKDSERKNGMDTVGIGATKGSDSLSKNKGAKRCSEDGESSIKISSNIPGSVFQSVEVKPDHISDMETIDAPDKFVSPLPKRLDQKLSASTEYGGSFPGDLKAQDKYDELVSIGSGEDRNSVETGTCDNHSTSITDRLGPTFAESIPDSGLPLLEINHYEEFTQVKRVDNEQSYIPNLQHVSETVVNIQTPSQLKCLKERNAPDSNPGNQDRNATGLTNPREKLPWEGNKASAPASASASASFSPIRTAYGISHESPIRRELTQSASRGDTNASDHESMQSLVGKESVSSDSKSSRHGNNKNHVGLNNLESQAQDIQTSLGQKRRIEELVSENADLANKFSRTKRSPNIHKVQGSNMDLTLEHSKGIDDGRETAGVGTTMKHWQEILLKFSVDTELLLSPLVYNLNIKAIGMLQDILFYLQKVKIYEMLCTQVQSQKICDPSSGVRHKRIAETRSFLYKLVYEKAKLQLMSVKHKKLMKGAQQLKNTIQELQMLKSNYIWHPSVLVERDTSVDNLQSLCVVSNEKIVTLRHKFEALDRKVKDLAKYFHCYCKIKGEASFPEIIVLLNDHLKKRSFCKFIRDDLQLWNVADLRSTDGQHNIFLNYQGFVLQSFTINLVPVPTIFISNKLNDRNITKSFPNMDAFVAFGFVLNAESTKKHAGSKNLADETQITSSLLHNLLDVVEEVQLAQIEIKNLVLSRFHSPCVDQLDLHLCFIDFNSGGKVMVTLNMTCLKWAVYPSDIIPYQLQVSTAGTNKRPPESLSTKIKAAVDGVSVGFSRIIRLCRCISQVVQSSST